MTVQTRLAWAPNIPDNWRVVPLKYVCKFTTGWTPPTGDSEAYVGDNLWANISDIGPREIHDTAKRLSYDAVQRHSIALSPEGSLLFSFKLSVGQVSFAGVDMYTNEAIATFRPTDRLNLNFAYYAFPEMIVRNASENIYGAKMLNQQLINSASLVLPPLCEQTAIAAFLDRETRKIDVLAQEQRRLIERLKEKRQAVISHAVTKGLDRSARLRPSGVVWLGDVPEHWEVVPVKRVSSLITSGPRGWSELIVDEGSIFFQSQNIGPDMQPILDDCKRIRPKDDAESRRALLLDDDVVVCITGARTGAVAHLGKLAEKAYLNQHVCLVRPSGVCGRYLAYAMSSIAGQQQLAVAIYGLKQGLSLDDVRSLTMPLPPVEEQQRIAQHLDRQLERFAALVTHAEECVRLLHERRASLISAAVTGKIDVREQPSDIVIGVPGLVAAEIVGRLSHMPTFGRVKFQKVVYLAEVEAGISEFEGDYLRAAAGPLDRNLIDRLEADLVRAGDITVEQLQGIGSPVRYRLRAARSTRGEELAAALGDRCAKLHHIIDAVADLDTKGTEAVATLYAVWNDFLLDGKQPGDDAITTAVLNDWHPEKRKKFRADELLAWLGWMRRHHLVPRGNGPRTTTGRLFV